LNRFEKKKHTHTRTHIHAFAECREDKKIHTYVYTGDLSAIII